VTTARPQWTGNVPRVRYAATISDCGAYRYDLEREFDADGEWALFIGLNPSTATAEKDDPTIRREMDFGQGFGLPNLAKVNLYGLRSTDPKGIREARIDPVGPGNDEAIRRWVHRAGLVILAWGYSAKVGPRMLTRAWEVRRLLREEFARMAAKGITAPPVGHLGFTDGKEHQPRHPLMLRADTRWEPIAP
jgi:hypothetical protein